MKLKWPVRQFCYVILILLQSTRQRHLVKLEVPLATAKKKIPRDLLCDWYLARGAEDAFQGDQGPAGPGRLRNSGQKTQALQIHGSCDRLVLSPKKDNTFQSIRSN